MTTDLDFMKKKVEIPILVGYSQNDLNESGSYIME